MEMKERKVRVTFTEELLGTASGNKDLHRDYIASKAPDAEKLEEEVEALGVELVERPLASETSDYARHSVARLSAAVMELLAERSIRIAHELGAEETPFRLEE